MKRTGLVMVLALVGLVNATGCSDAGAQSDSGGCANCMQLVGYTEQAHRMSPEAESAGFQGGVFRTYALCQADFGADHRPCFASEVINTLNLPAPPSSRVWLQSGAADCWAGQDQGLTMSGGGGFIRSDCIEQRAIACCGPR